MDPGAKWVFILKAMSWPSTVETIEKESILPEEGIATFSYHKVFLVVQ